MVGNLSIHICADEVTIETVFRTIICVNQLNVYGADSDLCEEYKACHVRTGRLVLTGQSDPLFVPSVMKTLTTSTDDPAPEEDLLQRYQERVEKLSQQYRVIKICPGAGFLTTVEVGQYFMTKDTEEFSQFTDSVACREYTLPRDEKNGPKGWIRGNTKIGPILEVTTSYLQGKYGVEEDDDNEQETSEMQFEDFALKTNVLAFASRSKAKAKPRRRTSACSSTRTASIGEKILRLILSHKIIRPSIFQCRSNWALFFVMVIHLEKKMERLKSGD